MGVWRQKYGCAAFVFFSWYVQRPPPRLGMHGASSEGSSHAQFAACREHRVALHAAQLSTPRMRGHGMRATRRETRIRWHLSPRGPRRELGSPVLTGRPTRIARPDPNRAPQTGHPHPSCAPLPELRASSPIGRPELGAPAAGATVRYAFTATHIVARGHHMRATRRVTNIV